jgi:hypothetical protein
VTTCSISGSAATVGWSLTARSFGRNPRTAR